MKTTFEPFWNTAYTIYYLEFSTFTVLSKRYCFTYKFLETVYESFANSAESDKTKRCASWSETILVSKPCSSFSRSFPTYILILTHLQLTIFENIVTKGEIAQNEQFLLLPQCFHFFSVIIPTIIENFSYFLVDILKVVCSRCVVCGKGLR